MIPVMIIIFLLSFSLHIDAALKCYHGHKRNSKTCEQKINECREGKRCVTIYEEYKNEKTFNSIFKGCWPAGMPCDVTAYARATQQLHILFSVKCCEEDYCNDKFSEMPEEGEPHGILCPSCYENNTLEECKADKQIMCNSKDDKCVNIACSVQNPDKTFGNYSARGCMSALGCMLDLSHLIGVKVLHQERFHCTDPLKGLNEEEHEEYEPSYI